MRIGIQGIPGSFSEIAAKTYFHDGEFEWVYLETSFNVCDALQNKAVDRGVIALENSIGGMVAETETALGEIPCSILDEVTIPIVQCLMVRKGVSLGSVKAVHSHKQALKQSGYFLTENLPEAERVLEDDTALCAKRLSEGELPETAAVIGNAACADLYGLHILKKGVQSTDDNNTRFLIVSFSRD